MSGRFQLTLLVITALGFAGWSGDAMAQRGTTRPKPTGEVFQVVQVDDQFLILQKQAVKEHIEGVMASYKEALAAYREAKKAAKKEKEEFNDPEPSKPKCKVHKGNYTSKQDAQEYIDKIDVWIVVEVDERYEAIRKASYDMFKRKVEHEHELAVVAWEKAKKQAKEDGSEFDEDKPDKPKVSIVKGTYKDEDEAKAKISELTSDG